MSGHQEKSSELDSLDDVIKIISGDEKPPHNHGHSHHAHQSKCHNHVHHCQNYEEEKINPGDTIFWSLKSLWIIIPFLLLFLFKEAVVHSKGLWVLVSLFVSSYYLNTRLVCAVHGFEPTSYVLVASIIVCSSVGLIHYTWLLRSSGIYLGLFCLPNTIPSDDWVSLLWAMLVVDFSLRIFTIFIKSVIVFLTPRLFRLSTRSAILVWTEVVSQVYRNIPPAVTWIRHLTGSIAHSLGFRIFFCLLYALLKLAALGVLVSSVWPLFSSHAFSLPYQTNVVRSAEDEGLCPLCLDQRSSDVAILGCNHVFCRDCVDRWLVNFNECPLCMHSLGEDFKTWRDGSTSALVHVF